MKDELLQILFDQSIGLLIGIIASLIAAIIYSLYQQRKRMKMEYKLYGKLEGTWVEKISKQEGRKYSIAKFEYNKKKNIFKYDGQNYQNNGDKYYKWKSVRVWHDRDSPRILYIYTVDESKKPPKWKEGFGVTNYDNNSNNFTDGYFVDADSPTEPKEIKFIRIEELASKLYFDLGNKDDSRLKEFIKRIKKYEEENGKDIF